MAVSVCWLNIWIRILFPQTSQVIVKMHEIHRTAPVFYMPHFSTHFSPRRRIWIGHVDHGDDFRWITDHPSLIRELWPGVTDQIGSYSRILISSVCVSPFELSHSSLISERLGSPDSWVFIRLSDGASSSVRALRIPFSLMYIRYIWAIALLTKAVRTSETSVGFCDTTRRYIPESRGRITRRRENLRSHLTQWLAYSA
jgi:hypothetical protein